MVKGVYGGECIEAHSVYIMDRGGKQRIAQLVDIAQVQWTRVRDDASEAQVLVRGAACVAQAGILANIEPKRSELVIFRGGERVWEGPVSLVGWHSDWVEIRAKDVVDYLFGRPLSKEWDNNYPNTTEVTTRLENIFDYELTEPYFYRNEVGNPVGIPAWEDLDPPANVLPYIVAHHFPNEVRTSAKTSPFQMSVGEHLDNYARTGGIDYTTVGRAIHIWDVSRSLGRTRTLTEADFFGEIIITAYGSDHASVAFTVADDGRAGGAGGVATNWKFLQKDGPAGSQQSFEPSGSTPRRPSIVDFGTDDGWNDRRYWIAYQPTTSSTMRVAGSNDGATWNDFANADVDADSAPGVTVTPGDFPALAFAYDERLWLFFIGTDGHLYRTRSDDGVDWTTKIDLYTPAGGVTLRSPSMYFNSSTGLWVMFAVNSTTNRIVYMTSTTNELDGPGQWGALNAASVAGNPDVASIEMRRIGNRWVGMMTTTGGDVYMIESHTALASGGFDIGASVAIPKAAAGKHDTLGKSTWLQKTDGNIDAWYAGSLSGTNHIFRTSVTGPIPDIGTGDPYMDYYGPWTKMFTVYDEDETHPPSQADLNSQAKRNLTGRSPVPIEVRVPDNSGIRLSHDLTIDILVPGVQMPLLATLNARKVSQVQKLDKLTVTETSTGETIQVTLVPATRPDDDIEEEG